MKILLLAPQDDSLGYEEDKNEYVDQEEGDNKSECEDKGEHTEDDHDDCEIVFQNASEQNGTGPYYICL